MFYYFDLTMTITFLGNKPCCFYFVVHDKFTPIRQNIKITKMK